METTLWLVGMETEDEEGAEETLTIGIFSTKEKARAACRTRDHWMAPLVLDLDLGDDDNPWPGFFFPMCEKEP